MIEYSPQYGYCWLWKVLITWNRLDISIGYYPDYENCTWGYTWKRVTQ